MSRKTLPRIMRFHSPKIDVPDSDWSESGTSVGRSRGLRFRGRGSAAHARVF
ncbi:MAG: hypothetical protein K2O61_07445 [Bacteroidaceae bacterium]|nr:hypothetical protein [Bacteroidaceae bacterium]